MGVAVLATSAAFACTSFVGKMTVTGGTGSTTVVGSGGAMQYCTAPADNAAAPGGGAHGTSGSSVKIAVAPATCGRTTQLPAGAYSVSFANGAAYSFKINATTHKRVYGGYKIDCMSRSTPGVVALSPSTLNVPSNGTASGTFKLPVGIHKNGVTDASALCVADVHHFNGLQSPIVIV
jgi:hypothetical protein